MEAITSFIDQYGALMVQGTWDTVVMTVLSTAFAYVIGIPLGVLLILTAPGGLHPHRVFNSVLGWLVNIGRSIPFIILLTAYLIKLSKTRRFPKWAWALCILSLAVFCWFYPVYAGVTIDRAFAMSYMRWLPTWWFF